MPLLTGGSTDVDIIVVLELMGFDWLIVVPTTIDEFDILEGSFVY